MKKKKIAVFAVLLLFFSLMFARVWILDDDGPSDFESFEDMAAHLPLDTVLIKNGVYMAPYGLRLIGGYSDGSLILGENRDSVVVFIDSMYVEYFIIKNITFRGSDIGLYLPVCEENGSGIYNCIIDGFDIGIIAEAGAPGGTCPYHWAAMVSLSLIRNCDVAVMYPYGGFLMDGYNFSIKKSILLNNRIILLIVPGEEGTSAGEYGNFLWFNNSWWGTDDMDILRERFRLSDNAWDWLTFPGMGGWWDFVPFSDSSFLDSCETSPYGYGGCNAFINYIYMACSTETEAVFEPQQPTENNDAFTVQNSDGSIDIAISPDFLQGGTTIELYNVLGKLIKQRRITNTHISVPTEKLPSGVYFLVLRRQRSLITRKCVILK